MKKFLAVLLAAVVILSLSAVALADNSEICGGKAIGEWMIYTPDKSINTDQNYLSIKEDKVIRNGREVYLFPIDDRSFYLADWYGPGKENPSWHLFTVSMGPDFNTMFMIRPTTDSGNLYLRK